MVFKLVILDSVGPEHDIKGKQKGLENVLLLAGIGVIFYIVANMGCGFGFVLKTVLIEQGCFSYC